MAEKYHIGQNGAPYKCNANIRECPRGGLDYHCDTLEEAQKLADRINEELIEANESIGNKINKLLSIFGKSRPLHQKIEKTKKLINQYENEIYKKEYIKFMKEEPFSDYTEKSFKEEFLKKDKSYLLLKKQYDNLILERSKYIQQRKKSIEIVKNMKPYIRGISFSNLTGSTYLVFGKADKENVLTLLKENNVIINNISIDENDSKKVFSVRISDHKKTRRNKTKTEVSAKFPNFEMIKSKEHIKEIKKLQDGERFIANLVREINGIKN